jgi:hypothetical protein
MLNELRNPVQTIAATMVLIAGLSTAVSASGQETKSKLESEPDGWVNILPPADLKGWYRVPVPPRASWAENNGTWTLRRKY